LSDWPFVRWPFVAGLLSVGLLSDWPFVWTPVHLAPIAFYVVVLLALYINL